MRADGHATGIAAEFFVLSQLHRIGLNAFLTLGNTKRIDILVACKDGSSISIDVKAVRGFASLPVNNLHSADRHFLVALYYCGKFNKLSEHPKVYVIPSAKAVRLSEPTAAGNRLHQTNLTSYLDNWDLISRLAKAHPVRLPRLRGSRRDRPWGGWRKSRQ